jgi:hypothetical protein
MGAFPSWTLKFLATLLGKSRSEQIVTQSAGRAPAVQPMMTVIAFKASVITMIAAITVRSNNVSDDNLE